MQQSDEEMMSPKQLEKLKEICHVAQGQSDRRAYLSQACAGDEELRREAESLLAADDSLPSSFLKNSAFAFGMQLLADDETRDDMTSETTQVFEAGISNEMILGSHWKIIENLDAGGMGEIYKAQDLTLPKRFVVVKVLKPKSQNNPWIFKKFGDEIQALSRIQHPNVVTILGKGELLNGEPYLVMEFIKAKTLRQMIKDEDQQMEFPIVTEIMKQVGRGVAAIHEANLIHRDLKPANLMVQYNAKTGDLLVKVVDFGIARILDKDTVIGHVPGTLLYMSPEQLKGQDALANDVYSMAVIAYEMLTGRVPFLPKARGLPSAALEILEMQKTGLQLKPRQLRPDLPEAAEAVILKGLAYDAGQRYQSAREFGDELARSFTMTPPSKRKIKRWHVAAAIILIAIAAVVLWLKLTTRAVSASDIVMARPESIKTNAPAPSNWSIYNTEFWFPTGKPPKGMVYAGIGFTVWRVRPVTMKDSAETAREIFDGAETASERVEEYITDGDKLYLGIESLTGDFMPDKGGYLYVTNREQYQDGTFGRARLIFPTLLTYGGSNRVKPGQPIVLPRAIGEPFIVRRSSSMQVAETFTVILSPWPFELPEPLSNRAMVVPDKQLAEWERQFGERMYRATLRGGVGQIRTRREQEIGSRAVIDGAESLTQDDPLPQICFRGAVKIGNPAMVTVALRFKN
jgi:serine/threonine protein kinase